jgi:Ser/Thr protein kinase RdoA (MazF antagonist)
VRWPPDHPAVTDPALAPWRAGAEFVCPQAEVVSVLGYQPGRRVATRVRIGAQEAVLKIFAKPRARGNHRRLTTLANTSAADLVPAPLGVDERGHVGLVEFVAGTPLADLRGDRLTEAACEAGEVLRRLHGSGAVLDREWSIDKELVQLRRTAGARTREAIEGAIERCSHDVGNGSVPAHRDCYPAQAVVGSAGVRLIDLDDAAMAPPGLDVGNFTAHLIKDAAVGAVPDEVARRAATAFIDGYGDVPADHSRWECLSLARLAGLAETRHRRPDDVRKLLDLLR